VDKIFIKDLLVRGILGINEWEREKQQDILINVTLYTPIREGTLNDSIEACVNYRTVAKKIIQHVENSSRFTVEALAADLASLCLEEKGVAKVKLSVEKPNALRFSKSVGVEITREKKEYEKI
jgi:FolB domain-containing protein